MKRVVVRGNCYVTSEALYHLLGGKRAGWTPQYMRTRETGNHWFLKHKSGLILDATAKQFPASVTVDYSKARGMGFLTKRPSKRAQVLMYHLTWQEDGYALPDRRDVGLAVGSARSRTRNRRREVRSKRG